MKVSTKIMGAFACMTGLILAIGFVGHRSTEKLNAAIKAARAGERGRGFAVVAGEVRELAERTTQSTTEVTQSVRLIQSKAAEAVTGITGGLEAVESGTQLATNAGSSLSVIVNSTEEVAGMIEAIASAARDQADSVAEISSTVNTVSDSFVEFNEQIDESARTMQSLSTRAEQFRSLAARFRM